MGFEPQTSRFLAWHSTNTRLEKWRYEVQILVQIWSFFLKSGIVISQGTYYKFVSTYQFDLKNTRSLMSVSVQPPKSRYLTSVSGTTTAGALWDRYVCAQCTWSNFNTTLATDTSTAIHSLQNRFWDQTLHTFLYLTYSLKIFSPSVTSHILQFYTYKLLN